MKAARKAAKAGTGKDKTAASKPGAIGSGVGASRASTRGRKPCWSV